ncbi:MAG: type IV toxin-antitoxin system AbiEi family antitoxin [Candidatus Brocadiia bacterium]
MKKTANLSVPDYVDYLQSRGRYTFSTAECYEKLSQSKDAIRVALSRLSRKGRIAALKKGFYVIVTLEYQSAGCLPAEWFIDDLMRYLDQAYYVGILSAAGIFGAAHQRPQVFQVVTDTQTDSIEVARVAVEFHTVKNLHALPEQKKNTRTGTVNVSTPELTAYDLFRFPDAAGGFDNIATILSELAETLDEKELKRVARLMPYHSIIQRFGYIMDFLGKSALVEPLAEWLAGRNPSRVKLHPGMGYGNGERNKKWEVIVNYQLEPDA